MRARAFAFLMLLSACSDEARRRPAEDRDGEAAAPAREPTVSASAVATPSSAAPAKDAFDKLSVSVGGKRAAITKAFIKRMEPDRFQVYLTDGGGSCGELIDNLFSGSDRVDVLANLTPRLAADGSMSLVVSDVFDGPSLSIEPGSKAIVKGKADEGTSVDVTIDFVAKDDGGKVIEAHGSFTAEGCGERREKDTSGVPKAAHPSTASITVAGKKLPLAGAIVIPASGSDDFDVLLSATPKDCSGWTPFAQVIVARERGFWRMRGTWLEEELQSTTWPDENLKDVKVVRGAKGTSDDGPTVSLELSGSGKIESYSFELGGTIEAIECPAPK